MKINESVSKIKPKYLLCKENAENQKRKITRTAFRFLVSQGKKGRDGRTRTYDIRFWRPALYQLSYTPTVQIEQAKLLGFAVKRMLLASPTGTIFLKFQSCLLFDTVL